MNRYFMLYSGLRSLQQVYILYAWLKILITHIILYNPVTLIYKSICTTATTFKVKHE